MTLPTSVLHPEQAAGTASALALTELSPSACLPGYQPVVLYPVLAVGSLDIGPFQSTGLGWL